MTRMPSAATPLLDELDQLGSAGADLLAACQAIVEQARVEQARRERQHLFTKKAWNQAYDDAMQWRDWQTCDLLLEAREQAEWYVPPKDMDE